MSAFLYLLLVMAAIHFAVDVQFQSDFVAIHKNRRITEGRRLPWIYAMLSHTACHGLAVGWFLANPLLGAVEMAAHFVIDCAKCEGYTNIHVDQALHIVCKAAWAAIIVTTA